ncbi:MAG: 3-deoxy-8-phosphooctulonate synthase, partial [Phycisphaerae bacterium]
MTSNVCTIGNVPVGEGGLALIAGPCVAESRELCLRVASEMSKLCDELGVGYIFKASYDKANRSSADGFRGVGLEKGLQWLADVQDEVGCPVLTDVHETAQVAPVAEVADCVQIPAFLCRQTDLLTEAGKLAPAVNIKKGQFMAPWDMSGAVEKVRRAGGQNVTVTERGTCFGYNRLVTDFRGIPQMREFAPVVFDATHSVQQPGALGSASGGERQFAPVLAAAAVAVGADALF